MRKYVWVVLLSDTSIEHSCRSLLDFVYETQELAEKRADQLNNEPRPPNLVYEIQRKILHGNTSL